MIKTLNYLFGGARNLGTGQFQRIGLIPRVINLISTILKYFNFTAIKSSNNLEISYGLIQTKSIILSPKKVQQFQIIQNYLQKTLDILEIKINQASSTKIVKDNSRSKIIIPGFTKNEKNDLFKYIFNKKIQEEIQMKPHVRKLIFRLIFTSVLPALIFSLIFLFFEILTLKYVLITSLSLLIFVLKVLAFLISLEKFQIYFAFEELYLKKTNQDHRLISLLN